MFRVGSVTNLVQYHLVRFKAAFNFFSFLNERFFVVGRQQFIRSPWIRNMFTARLYPISIPIQHLKIAQLKLLFLEQTAPSMQMILSYVLNLETIIERRSFRLQSYQTGTFKSIQIFYSFPTGLRIHCIWISQGIVFKSPRSIYNHGLRIVLGTIRTSPAASTSRNESSFYFRRKNNFFSQNILKPKSNPFNLTHQVVFNPLFKNLWTETKSDTIIWYL